MSYRDPKCVFVADDFGTAGVLVSWLASHGIEASVMDEATLGGLEGLTAFAPGMVSTRGLEVWVGDESDAERAKQLLEAKRAEIDAEKTSRAERTAPVVALCEECGKSSHFPPSAAGRTENCPHCRAYLDVPDPDAPPGEEYWNVSPEDGE